MKKIILYFLFSILISTSIYSQLSPKLDWFKSYDGISKGNDFVNDVKFDNNFNCYLAGRSTGLDGSPDLLIIKYSKYGELIEEIKYVPDLNSWDEANSIAIDTYQNIYAIGNASFDTSTPHAILIKYSPNGNLVWKNIFYNSFKFDGEGVVVALDYKDNIIAGIDGNGVIIIKFSSNGDSLWSVNINNDTSWFNINNLITDANSNIYFTYTRSYYNGGDIAETEIILSKINKSGQIEWSNSLDIDSPRKILFDRDSNLVVISHGDARLIKYNSDGDLIWDYDSDGLLTDISVDNNNDIILCGYNSGVGTFDYMTKKISKDGIEIWEESFNSIENLRDYATSVVIDNENNIYVTGDANNMFSQGIIYTLKYDTNGNMKWQFRYDISHSIFEHPQNIFLDDSNNVIIAGDYTDSTNGSNFFVLKIKQKLGTSINQINNTLLNQYSLSQNFPNPFNPTTTISYSILTIARTGRGLFPQYVLLSVYDILGREVARLINKRQEPGQYKITWNAADQPSGVYLYRIHVGDFTESKKMILQK